MSEGVWSLFIEGDFDGEENMRRDRALYDKLEEEPGPPALRIYGWRPWTVSLGRHQDPTASLDLDEIARRGYGWVRRPTGGRAVFHAREITYCLAARQEPPFDGGLADTHRKIAGALLRFYRSFGLEPTLTRPAPARDLDPRSQAPCFVAPGLAEIELEGRKLAGSAQRRGRHAFLQHGSLPLGTEHLLLPRLLAGSVPLRARLARGLAARSISLEECVPKLLSRAELARRLAEAFAEEFRIRWAGSSPRLFAAKALD